MAENSAAKKWLRVGNRQSENAEKELKEEYGHYKSTDECTENYNL